MSDKKIRIERIKVKDLHEFACRTVSRTKENDVIPITKHRALAHTNNPYADENDIGLLVAYIGNQCIGYLGLMPGLLKEGDKFSKVHWFSTWFVPPEFRKTSVGLLLMMNALSLKYDLIATGISNETERICRGLGFHELGPLDYYVINVDRMNFLALTFRLLRNILSKIRIKSKITDAIIRASERIFYLYCFPGKRHQLSNLG